MKVRDNISKLSVWSQICPSYENFMTQVCNLYEAIVLNNSEEMQTDEGEKSGGHPRGKGGVGQH